jgi:hypothetical protein
VVYGANPNANEMRATRVRVTRVRATRVRAARMKAARMKSLRFVRCSQELCAKPFDQLNSLYKPND